MGGAKNLHVEEEEAKDGAWYRKCAYEGWTCARCGSPPPREEREIFFKTGLCGYCEHMTSKDD
jgi:hypothetical protein